MRAFFSTVLCLSMAVCIIAVDLELGERQPGDYICANRTIFKPPIPWKPMIATIGMKALSPNETLTYVKISNVGNKEADFIVVSGDVGTASIIVRAVGKLGEGLFVQVEGYAIDPNTITTTVPITTEELTTIEEVTTAEEHKDKGIYDDRGVYYNRRGY